MAFAVPAAVNALPVQLVPCVNVAPELNVIPLASAAFSLCGAPEQVMLPLKLPFEPADRVIVIALVPVSLSAEPLGTMRSDPVAPEMVRIALATPACRFTVVLPETDNCPIV